MSDIPVYRHPSLSDNPVYRQPSPSDIPVYRHPSLQISQSTDNPVCQTSQSTDIPVYGHPSLQTSQSSVIPVYRHPSLSYVWQTIDFIGSLCLQCYSYRCETLKTAGQEFQYGMAWYNMVWYGMVGFKVPLNTLQVISGISNSSGTMPFNFVLIG